jgi:hypothetical protein
MAIEMTLRQLLLSVSGETTVPVELLVEDEDFMGIIREGGFTYGSLLDWVNENY